MDKTRVKEALSTALMLSQIASKKHKVKIDWLGEVFIDNNYSAYVSDKGKLTQLTSANIDEKAEELIHESFEFSVKRRIKELSYI
ncbi:MAG: hypothetical protein HOD92_25590 [Deltaproteobacteria bacterium]|jgi:hypothetical protein|nr:hypothetical protein [Deltaproteobacteria bacterium]MBT4525433.1 hypothetical protein [Deltaproteobacteria bacterium]